MSDVFITAKIAGSANRFARLNVRHIVGFAREIETKDRNTISVSMSGGWEYHIEGDVSTLENAIAQAGDCRIINMEAFGND